MTKRNPPLIKSTKSTKIKKIKKHRSITKKKKKNQVKKIKAEKNTLNEIDNDNGNDNHKAATAATVSNTDILDPNFYFDADAIHKSTTMGCSKLLSHARRTILELLKARDYRPCLSLLAALIETCKFKTLAYWKVGEEIIRNCHPEDLSVFLGSVVSGIRAPKNISVWKEQLLYILNDQGYTAFMEHIESSTEKQHHDELPINKLLALVMYEAWESMTKKKQTDVSKMHRLLFATKDQLDRTYELNPADRFVIRAYLKVLSAIATLSNENSVSDTSQRRQSISEQTSETNTKDPATRINQVVDTALQREINDPELMCILLHYGHQGLDDDMSLAITACSDDPIADARIKFLPTMKSMKSVPKTDLKYIPLIMARVGLIVERLEHGVTDTYTLDELDDLLDEIENAPHYIKYNIMSFFASIDLPMTLDYLQLGAADDDIIALDTLEFLKFKVTDMLLCH